MPPLLIITDSTCDLPPEWVQRYDIRVVPTYVQFGLESLADDGVELTRRDFYRRLASSSVLPTTAAPSLGQTKVIMEQAIQDANHVIGITAPAKLSSIHNSFRLAAEQVAPDRITLIDSGMLSMGLGWLVIAAAEMAQNGASLQEVRTAVEQARRRTIVWAALSTLEYLRRSGRVSWAAAIVGELFQIRPVVRLYNSEVTSATRVRTSQRSFQALVDLARRAAPLERLAILHSNYREGAERLCEALTDIHPDHERVIVDVTPVIGVHVGPNGLGLAIISKESQD
jgi:DegV family protein with EDD domain